MAVGDVEQKVTLGIHAAALTLEGTESMSPVEQRFEFKTRVGLFKWTQ